MDDPFARLRGLLDAPSSESWEGLCELLLGWKGPEADVALDYARTHIESWDDALRWVYYEARQPALFDLWPDFPQGEPLPLWSLVSGVHLTECSSDIFETHCAAFASSHFQDIRRLALPERGDWGLSVLLPQDPTRRWKELRCESLHSSDLRWLFEHPAFAGLEHLNVAHSDLHDGDIQALVDSPLRELRVLDLHNCEELSNHSLAALAASPHMAHLEELSIGITDIDSAGLEQLSSSPHIRLKRFYMGGNHFGDAGLEAMARSEVFADLEEAFWWDSGLGVQAIKSLVDAPWSRHLKGLILSGNGFADAGVQLLTEATHMAGLERLWMGNCGITDLGAQMLAEATHLGHLQQLYLEGNVIQNPKPLRDAPHLQQTTVRLD